MKKILLTIIALSILFTNYSFGQFCNATVVDNGVLVPLGTSQNTASVSTGRNFWTFNATAGCTYTFSTCGLSTMDTYLRIYATATGGAILVENDDACGLQSTVNFICPADGVYSILLTRYNPPGNCAVVNAATQLSYSFVCPPPNNDCGTLVPSALTSPGNLTFTGTSAGSIDLSVGGSLGSAQVWEAFTITECANVVINTCGTAPAFTQMFTSISTACPANFPSTFITSNSLDFTTCADGNSTAVFNNLAPGTYYVPVMGAAPDNHAYTLNISAVDFIAQPVITPASATTFCIGGSVQLDLAQQVLPSEISVTVSGISFLDETTWTLTNSLGSVISTGGSYGVGSTNTITVSASNGPFTFDIETQGAFNDNVADYSITCATSGLLLSTGTVNGGLTTSVPNLACSGIPLTYTWTPSAGLNVTTGISVVATPTVSTTYTVTATTPSSSCTNAQTIDVLVTPLTLPTFTQLGPFCQNATPPLFPTTSSNGIGGTWNAAISTTTVGSTTYTFTPTAGLCASTATMSIVVSPNVTPTFTQLGPFCQNATPPLFPTTSSNGIGGTWNAAISTTTVGSTTYTFTPTAGLCASTATMSIVVSPNVTPTFTQLGPFCQNVTPPLFPTTSSNGIGGTWNSAISTTTVGSTTYTFTPTAGLCATSATMSIVVSPNVIPTFTQLGPFCLNAIPPLFPTTSSNGIGGTWNTAISTAAIGSTTYNFTPTAGQCAVGATMDIVVSSSIVPTFTQLGPFCLNATPPLFPTTSSNGIVGTWNAAISTAAIGSTTYNFTPTAGQCALGATMDIVVSSSIVPTFTQLGPFCLNATPPLFPTTSSNGIGGTWNAAISTTTVGSTTYTFTPTAGLCASTATMSIVVSPNVTPTFTQLGPFCLNATPPLFPTTSSNGIGGTWNAAISTTTVGSTTYTFTPTAGLCASSATMSIVVSPNVIPTFTQLGPFCLNATPPLFPTTSSNGIGGTWNAAISTTTVGTTTYTFTPTAGLCASSVTMDVVVTSNIPPTFAQLGPFCLNATPPLFPTTSSNGIAGTWNAAISTTTVGTVIYTFTPTAGQCATTTTMTITINSGITPTFTQVAPICSGGSITLPNPSNNSISGSWSPAINNTATTPYTFTPTAGQCATTATMTVTVNPNVPPNFTPISPICSGGAINLPISSPNGISGSWSPAVNNTATTTYTFTPTAGQCATTATMTIVVTPTTIPTFTAIAPICSGGTFSLSAISNNGVFGSWTPAFDNTVTTTYTFTPLAIPGQCSTTTTVTITVNPSVTPTFVQVAPICAGGALSALPLTSTNGVPGTWSPALNSSATTTYTFTPTSGQCATSATMTIVVNPNVTPNFVQIPAICSGGVISLPISSPNGIVGSWSPAPNNTVTTTYTFTPTAGQCATTATMTITVNPTITPTFTQVGTVCFGASFTLPIPSNNGITGTWSPAPNNTSTSSYLFTPTAGQCATIAFMGVTVVPNVIPTFNPIAPICSGASLSLPLTSTNGISGTWSPAINNTATTIYTFTPSGGQCAVTTTLTVTVTPNVTPTFAAVSPICSGAALAALPSPSTNGIPGTWTPALNNTITTTYTFTPTAGLCATTQTLTIIVNPNVTPNFVQVAPICVGGTLTALPTTSPNGVTGNWFPALNNTVTTTYTFTPTIGLCATTTTMTIVVNPIVTPTFAAVGPICSGASLTLPTPSIEGISGTWSPAVNNTATTTYTFTPAIGQCAVSTTMTVTVTPNVTPIFTAVSPICAGATLAPLPSPSNNGIPGTWFPALNNAATTTYTFTATVGICATTQTMTITVNPNIIPDFVQVAPICVGVTLAALPTTSPNGITGTWSPALNNATTTFYTFNPTAGLCATTATMTIVVNPIVTPSFNPIAAICEGASLALPNPSINGISGTWSPVVNNTANTTYTFTPGVGQCAVTTTLAVNVTPNVPTVFTQVSPICSGTSLILPTPSDNGITGTWSPSPNNTATTTYTFTPTSGVCATSETMTVTVTPNVTPTFASVAPICVGGAIAPLPSPSTNGIPGTWSPALDNTQTTTYTFAPSSGICATSPTLTITVNQLTIPVFAALTPICIGSLIAALPTSSINGINGTWSPALDNTQTTNYTFAPAANQCADTTTLTIVVNPLIPATFAAVAPICAGATLAALPTTSNEGFSGVWSPALDNTQTTTYTFTPDAGQCADDTTLTIIVNTPSLPTFTAVGPICVGNTYNLLSSSIEGITGIWSPAIDNTQTMTYTFTPNAGQCATTATMTVSVVSASDADFTISSYCNGVGAAPIVTGLPGGVFSFNPTVSDGALIDPLTGVIASGVAGTTYVVQYTLTGTCTVFSQELVSFVTTPTTPVLSNDTTYCLTSTFVSLTATNSGGTTSWFSDLAMTNLLGTGTNLLPSISLGTSTYYVSENLQGCLSPMDSVVVTVNDCYEFTAPSAFTPDGDGVNESWVIAELNVRYPKNNVTIFNRWGQLLYNSDGYLIPWDGRFDNKDLPVGSYYYIIDFNDALDTPNATGIVTIIRN